MKNNLKYPDVIIAIFKFIAMKKIQLFCTFFLLLLCLIPVSAQDSSSESVKKDTVAGSHKKDFGVAGMPTLSFNRSRGMGFGAMGMMFFKLGHKEETPPSRVVLNGQYTTKKNWYTMAFSQLFLFEDFIRLSLGGGYMDSHFQTFADVAGYGEMEIPYSNDGVFFFVAPLFQVYPKLYIGPSVQYFHSDVTFEAPLDSIEHDYSNALGISVVYDTKDNQYNPSKGITSSLRYSVNPTWMKNDDAFTKLYFFTNYYHRLDKTKVLASRVSANISLGDVPFSAQSYVGGKDIRGYTQGEFRGNQTYAAQSELRWNVYKRFGTVAFFGLAMTVDPASQLLPGGGVGIRYNVLPKYGINAGIDGALGKDDWGVYFRMTEAF